MKLKPQIFEIIGKPRAGYLSAHATPEHFGAGIGRGIGDLGRGLAGLGRDFLDMQTLRLNKGSDDITNLYSAWLQTNAPEWAKDPTKTFDDWKAEREKALNDFIENYGDKYSTSALRRGVTRMNMLYDAHVEKGMGAMAKQAALKAEENCRLAAKNNIIATGDLGFIEDIVSSMERTHQTLGYDTEKIGSKIAELEGALGAGTLNGLPLGSDEEWNEAKRKSGDPNSTAGQLGMFRRTTVEGGLKQAKDMKAQLEREINQKVNADGYQPLIGAYAKDPDVRAGLGKLVALREQISGMDGLRKADENTMRILNEQIETRQKLVNASDSAQAVFQAAKLDKNGNAFPDERYFSEPLAENLLSKLLELQEDAKAHPGDVEKETMAKVYEDMYKSAKARGELNFSRDARAVSEEMFEKDENGNYTIKSQEQIGSILARFKDSPMMTSFILNLAKKHEQNSRVSSGTATKQETVENMEAQNQRMCLFKSILADPGNRNKRFTVSIPGGGVVELDLSTAQGRTDAYNLFAMDKDGRQEIENFVIKGGTTPYVATVALSETISALWPSKKKYTPEYITKIMPELGPELAKITMGIGPTKDGVPSDAQYALQKAGAERLLTAKVEYNGKEMSLMDWIEKRSKEYDAGKGGSAYTFERFMLEADEEYYDIGARNEAGISGLRRYVAKPIYDESTTYQRGEKMLRKINFDKQMQEAMENYERLRGWKGR